MLSGSVARRTDHALSDVDVYALGEGPEYRLERHGGRLVSISWRTSEAVRSSFCEPAKCAAAVGGWRDAVVLHDPDGLAAALKREAEAWTWEGLATECNAYVAEAITGLAEEWQKLRAALARGDEWDAPVQRSVLGLHVPMVMAVHLRLMPVTEAATWPMVAERMGTGWGSAMALALGGGQDWVASGEAALWLFERAARELDGLLDTRQRAVVAPSSKF